MDQRTLSSRRYEAGLALVTAGLAAAALPEPWAAAAAQAAAADFSIPDVSAIPDEILDAASIPPIEDIVNDAAEAVAEEIAEAVADEIEEMLSEAAEALVPNLGGDVLAGIK